MSHRPFAELALSPFDELAMSAAILCSLATMAVGFAAWRRRRARGSGLAAGSARGPWLELGCFGLNVGVLVFAYRETFRAWDLLAESQFAKIDLVLYEVIERLSLLALATGVLLPLAALAAAVCWWGRGRAKAIVNLSPDLSAALLAARLAAIRAGGYPNVRFELTDVRTEERPMLGRLVGVSRSAVAVTLAGSDAECGAVPFEALRLGAQRWRDSRQVIVRILELRRAGERVCVVGLEPR